MLWLHFKKKANKRKSRIFWSQRFFQQLENDEFKLFLLNSINISTSLLDQQRRYWAFDYEQNWFEIMMENKDHPVFIEMWMREFRVRPETFDYIVDLVRDGMTKNNTLFRNAVPVEKRIAAAIWRLATGHSYRSVSKVFGIAKSTSVLVTQEFLQQIQYHVAEFISFPTTELETSLSIRKFKETVGCEIPQVVGAIDATHVEILAPSNESRVDYFSRKQKYTVLSQAVVGAN